MTTRVLIADDNVDAADTLSLLLQSVGIETAVVYDGTTALQLIAADRFDAAILGLGMPGVDGWECGRQIRDRAPSTLLVALSGYAASHHRQMTEKIGFGFHFAKPLEGAQLEGLIDIIQSWRCGITSALMPESPNTPPHSLSA